MLLTFACYNSTTCVLHPCYTRKKTDQDCILVGTFIMRNLFPKTWDFHIFGYASAKFKQV
jgi:hypothetical protein